MENATLFLRHTHANSDMVDWLTVTTTTTTKKKKKRILHQHRQFIIWYRCISCNCVISRQSHPSSSFWTVQTPACIAPAWVPLRGQSFYDVEFKNSCSFCVHHDILEGRQISKLVLNIVNTVNIDYYVIFVIVVVFWITDNFCIWGPNIKIPCRFRQFLGCSQNFGSGNTGV